MSRPDARADVREPVRQPWLWVGVIAIILAGIPWYLPEGTIAPIVLGVPLWTLPAVGSSVALCGFLHWALSRLWNLVEDDEETTTGPTGTTPDERGGRD